MLVLGLLAIFLCCFFFVLGLFPIEESRPTLESFGIMPSIAKRRTTFLTILRRLSVINKPLVKGALQQRLNKDLTVAHVNLTPEEFMLIKQIGIVLSLFLSYPYVEHNIADLMMMWIATSFVVGYMGPEFWLKGRIRKTKAIIVKELPDAIDLLGLCVNAGLDFMLALKWVVEKSPQSVMTAELNTILQEINIGKTRREAIKDLAARYELPDLSTFARTLIQADKMGTSVTEALNILSEDMRIARYRRGEAVALKAPLKMLVPLLFFIFPVVGILVAGPIMLDFIENNPFSQVAG